MMSELQSGHAEVEGGSGTAKMTVFRMNGMVFLEVS
jgi:hypothetical protein